MSLKKINSILAVILLTLAPLTKAGILLDKSIIDFPSDQPPRQDVTVSNQSNEIAYVQVTVLKVINPGTEEEQRIPVTDQEEIDFIASPSKLAIPPKGRKQVRLVSLSRGKDEQVYRVNFKPVLPPLQDETEGIGVRVVIAYQVLSLIHPEEPQENLIVEREENRVTFRNEGNTYALITDISQCNKDGADCKNDLGAKRLYVGNIFTVDLPYGAMPVTYKLTTFKGTRDSEVKK